MAAWLVIGTACAAIPFYVRFLIAICTECWRARVCYLVRIKPGGREIPMIAAHREPRVTARAA